MNEIDEEKVKAWGLTVCDSVSTKLKANLNLKNLSNEEIIYGDYIEKTNQNQWVVLCEEVETQKSLMVALDYTALISTTNNFFSSGPELIDEPSQRLSFTERFIGKKVSDEILTSFTSNDMAIKFIRNETDIQLVQPFHEDESISLYSYEWTINNQAFGALRLCHSHVL